MQVIRICKRILSTSCSAGCENIFFLKSEVFLIYESCEIVLFSCGIVVYCLNEITKIFYKCVMIFKIWIKFQSTLLYIGNNEIGKKV